jgi:hypothetical protein
MFVTSTSEVVFPGVDKFMVVLLNQCRNFVQLQQVVAFILDLFNFRFKPELGFPFSGHDMHVHARFFARKEKEAVTFLPEYGWAHVASLHMNYVQHTVGAGLARDRPQHKTIAGRPAPTKPIAGRPAPTAPAQELTNSRPPARSVRRGSRFFSVFSVAR